MAQCDECGRHENLPYQCRRCGGTFCAEHRLPENHDCPGLDQWDDPSGVFDSGFDDSVQSTGGSSGFLDRLTGTGGPLGYFRGNVAYLFLALMWVTFALQILLGPVLHLYGLVDALFVLRSNHLAYVWTWVTSIFAHGGLYHIAGNSIVLYFFGPLVERYVGSKRFAALFLLSGVAAGLGFVGSSLLLGNLGPSGVVSVIGASGAIFAVLGVLTVLNPHLRIYLYFIIPIPLWLFTIAFAAISMLFFLSPGTASSVNMGNVAHLAHLIGLVIGLAYGERIKGRHQVPDSLSFGGGRGPGPGRRR
ncbi:MAG: rhomboid family intramembrane serine protease [Haloplanus sp.]